MGTPDLMDMGFLLEGNENVLNLIVVIVAQLGKYAKNYQIVHFKGVSWYVNHISIRLLSLNKQPAVTLHDSTKPRSMSSI